jgi:hypothetical protein
LCVEHANIICEILDGDVMGQQLPSPNNASTSSFSTSSSYRAMPLPPAHENPASLAELCSSMAKEPHEIYVDQVKVGEGATGIVYRARMRPNMNEVALKVMQVNRQNTLLVANEISIMKVRRIVSLLSIR